MSASTMSPRVRRLLSVGVFLSIGAGLAGFALATRTEAEARTAGPGVDPLVVETMDVRWTSSYDVVRTYVGRVEARQESEIGFEIPGLIAEVLVDEGEAVAAETVVAALDDARLQARRAELIAARDEAQADLELAELTLVRTEKVRALNAASEQEMDEADKRRLAAAAALARAKATLASIEVDIEKTVLRAPFDAIVARRLTDVGRVVNPGASVLELYERRQPEVRLSVAGDVTNELAVGASVTAEIAGRGWPGRVSAVLPTRDRVGRGVDVIITLDAALDDLRRGDVARVDVVRTVDANGFWAPVQALTEGVRGLWSVYTVTPESEGADLATLRRADVEVLHHEGDRAFVRGPLPDGQRIAARGLHRTAPGMVVRWSESAWRAAVRGAE